MDAKNTGFSPDSLSQGHFDINNPLSLYSKMGSKWAKKFIDKLGENPCCVEFLSNETELKSHLETSHRYLPTGGDNRYRLQMWLEYENSVKMERPMRMSNVYSLVGPDSTFENVVMKSPERVVWMLCKPIAYQVRMREMLDTGITRLRSYLDVDALTAGKEGKPDLKLMKLQLEITRMADLREHGAPTQKIQEISLKGTIGPGGELQALTDKMDMAALEERRKSLEARRRKAEGRAAAVPAAGGEMPIMDAEVVNEAKEVAEVAGAEGGELGNARKPAGGDSEEGQGAPGS
jgi:hypothetical protein